LEESVEYRLAGLRQDESGRFDECPIEHLLLLRGGPGGIPLSVRPFPAHGKTASILAADFARDEIARPLAERHRSDLLATLPERERFVEAGYRYEEDNLLVQRVFASNRAREGDNARRAELERIKQRQRSLEDLQQRAIAALGREPELIEPCEMMFLAHALVIPSSDPEDKKRHDEEIEKVAVPYRQRVRASAGLGPARCIYSRARPARRRHRQSRLRYSLQSPGLDQPEIERVRKSPPSRLRAAPASTTSNSPKTNGAAPASCATTTGSMSCTTAARSTRACSAFKIPFIS
jgi:hypothetical protein